ncbi:MAG: penicillin-binding protein [Bacteroidetes bacterium]|nr:penicillin-binding protein [Bacteroidota bacterium]
MFLATCLLSLLAFSLLSALFPLPPLKPYSLLIEDRNGEFLGSYLAGDGIWRIRTSPAEIPEKLKRILIEREDRWFYHHPGVNPVSVVRALVLNLRRGKTVVGASTITMQVARMLEPKERTYGNKLVEMFRALQLEWRYSKEQLLELYLSMVPLGGNIEGLKSAAMIYYQTPLERLNIAQLVDLILIPGNPNGLQPDRNPEALLAQRRRQAAAWIASGLLSPQDSTIIWNTPSAAERRQLPRHAPHYCLRLREKAGTVSDVRSSLDLRIQRVAEALLSSHMRPWKQRGVKNGALIVVDNKSREVLAYAGSENFEDAGASGQVDAAVALRSPGSTLKPFLFSLLMEKGELTPKLRLLDTPYDAEGFLAENYDGTYSGSVFADDALRRSLNVPMIRLLKGAAFPAFLELAAEAGFASLEKQRRKLGLSVILGGCGVTLEELVAAYAVFPSGGQYRPLCYTAVNGENRKEARRVCSSSTAYMVTEILAGLNRPDLPNNFEASVNLPAVAFKTGTSYGRRDAWAIGYSAMHTIGVWIGNVTHDGNPDLLASKAAAPLLIDIFNSISARHEKAILPLPKDLGMRLVCAESGLPPSARCTNVIEDLYAVSRTLQRECTVCKEYLVSTDGTLSYCPECLARHSYRAVTLKDYPPELLAFWKRNHVGYEMPPPHNPLCTRVLGGDGPAIVSPSDNMTYYLVSRGQKLALQASAGLDVKAIAWYLNDRYIGRRDASEKLFVSLSDGDHTVTCMDDKGRVSKVHITVKLVL